MISAFRLGPARGRGSGTGAGRPGFVSFSGMWPILYRVSLSAHTYIAGLRRTIRVDCLSLHTHSQTRRAGAAAEGAAAEGAHPQEAGADRDSSARAAARAAAR